LRQDESLTNHSPAPGFNRIIWGMSAPGSLSGWIDSPLPLIPAEQREEQVRYCSLFANDLLDRFPSWLEGLDEYGLPDAGALQEEIDRAGLDAGLRMYRNRQMLGIIWRDLCGLSSLAETFSCLTRLAEVSLQAAIDEHGRRLQEKHGIPRQADGGAQQMIVIAMGKFGGGELNLSSDIDLMFCYPESGVCDGRRQLSNDQFFTRQARAVISSLSDITEHGFCFRVDTRLRPFGDSGPLSCSMAAMEQYYQREGRQWERYALIKARPAAGDFASGARLLSNLRPFVYRRYIDFGSVEALQEMHASVQEDALRKDRLDDIKRGAGGIREIEFLAQCFQILRGGRDVSLQTPSLDQALEHIESLGLMSSQAVAGIRRDYVYLRLLENRIQALRDQQTHRLPQGEDLQRIVQAMGEETREGLTSRLAAVRQRVSARFNGIFPARTAPQSSRWSEEWRQLKGGLQNEDEPGRASQDSPLTAFLRQLNRFELSPRAARRLDRFMPVLLEQLASRDLERKTLNRVYDLVLTICRRSAYLVLLNQHVPALERMLDLFETSEWVAAKVIRFPALLDELIAPSLGQQIPTDESLADSVRRLLDAAHETETVLAGLNDLKLATSLRIAVAQLAGSLSAQQAQRALSSLAAAILEGVLQVAAQEIAARHGWFRGAGKETDPPSSGLAIIAYGTLGAAELSYESDLDIVFLFEPEKDLSDGARPLAAERYYARLAQRVLSFMTVMTPSGRLYEIDTRLRPNGRAGALVSSVTAFQDYQMKEAWTWEMQALTRARFIAGNTGLRSRFDRIRQDALCRKRDPEELRASLLEMRSKMHREHQASVREDAASSPKYRAGGLIDIEFIAQFGVLSSAWAHPGVIRATGSLSQMTQLAAIEWLTKAEAESLIDVAGQLCEQRMMAVLVPGQRGADPDTRASAGVFKRRLGGSAE
jgi:glutamate-ammonia-ligase adenylyltransferase